MIRSTVNATIKTVSRSIVGESLEVVHGSPDGVAPAATTEMSEKDYLAANPANTYTIVPSNEHSN